MPSYFSEIAPVQFAGPASTDPLAFKWYDRDKLVLGKRMEDHLRFAACYWHSFCWNGFDPFGYDGTFERPWQHVADPMAAARAKADAMRDPECKQIMLDIAEAYERLASLEGQRPDPKPVTKP